MAFAICVLVAVLMGICTACSGGGGEADAPTEAAREPAEDVSAASTAPTDDAASPPDVAPTTDESSAPIAARVPVLQPCELLSPDALGLVLGADVVEGERVTRGGADACDYRTPVGDPVLLLQIDPGVSRAAFDSRIAEGRARGGSPEPAVTPAAVAWWDAPGGVLVAWDSELMVQVALARPGQFEAADERAVAETVLHALLSRLGPFRLPVARATEQEPGAPPPVSIEQVLLAKVAAGEWTLAEGLATTLRALVGDAPIASLTGTPPEWVETTNLLALAREAVASGEAGAEVAALVDRLYFDKARLDAMTVAELRTSQVAPGAAQAPEIDCSLYYTGTDEPPAEQGCIRRDVLAIAGHQIYVYVPLSEIATGWSDQHFTWARTVLDQKFEQFLAYGVLPDELLVVFVAAANVAASMGAVSDGAERCAIAIYANAQPFDRVEFQFAFAHELGHCLQGATFPAQDLNAPSVWREEGLAHVYGDLAYPTAQRDRRDALGYADRSLAETLFQFDYENVVWFQFLRTRIGWDGIRAFILAMPTSGSVPDQVAALERLPAIDTLYHEFVEAAFDGRIMDHSGQAYFPALRTDPNPTLDRVGTAAEFRMTRFGASRLRVTVPAGTRVYTTLETDPVVHASTRTVQGDQWSPLAASDGLSATCDEDVAWIIVLTTTAPPDLARLGVVEVEELDCPDHTAAEVTEAEDGPIEGLDPCLAGTWAIDNERFRSNLDAFLGADLRVTQVTGRLELRLAADGGLTAEVDDFTVTYLAPWGLDPERVEGTLRWDGATMGSWAADGTRIRVDREAWQVDAEVALRLDGDLLASAESPLVTLLDGVVGGVGSYRCEADTFSVLDPDGTVRGVWLRR